MRKIFLLMVCLFTAIAGLAQNINNYKYIIIPERFEFQRETGEYNLNELTKMMFEKKGLTAYYAKDKLPEELAFDKCKAAYADVILESSFLTTGLTITVKDCWGKELFTSVQGVSKEKELKRAYYQALREASRSLDELNYTYKEPGSITLAKPVTKTEEVTVYVSSDTDTNAKGDAVMLFAQPIANGYQLVDSAPKVILKIYKTSQPDFFIADMGGRNGVVFKKGTQWLFEYYEKEKLMSEPLSIKF